MHKARVVIPEREPATAFVHGTYGRKREPEPRQCSGFFTSPMTELNLESLSSFLASNEEKRNQIPTGRQIEEESGLPQGYLNKILKGELKLTEARKAKLLPVLKKYRF
ncbi:hypothetical protein AHMF7605_11725 [Adhaeribacter arboris]|uniref:Uncharacterized protein n=1 Tax=Adhaeribacter arboris TaxID=2072846 RepID=A0A2T2YF53_9BACT|nr:hypothetical protein [Adhaeribacter arboris]PSR54140.1 hypothetical protein AHMF7605_11725 [Adhaeribacter arboris]